MTRSGLAVTRLADQRGRGLGQRLGVEQHERVARCQTATRWPSAATATRPAEIPGDGVAERGGRIRLAVHATSLRRAREAAAAAQDLALSA